MIATEFAEPKLKPGLPDDLVRALDRLAEALAAMGHGDPAPYAAMWPNDPYVTLFGAWGPIERGHDPVTRTFTWAASRFSGGAIFRTTTSSPAVATSRTRSASSTGRSGSTADRPST